MAPTSIRLARAHEHEAVSALALRSKGHWGYTAEFLDACRPELTFDEADCGSGLMWVAEVEGRVSAMGLLGGAPPAGELVALFVDPDAIGTGLGGRLLRHLLREARARGFARLDLDADPGAAPFYEHLGAVTAGTAPSGSVPGRVLPHLRFTL